MATVNDGNVPYGSYLVTIGSTAYVATDLNPSRPTNLIDRYNELNVPSGQVIIPDFETLSMTVQRPTTSTDLPATGSAVILPTGAGVATTGWKITDPGAAYSQGDDQTFSITARRIP